MRSISKKWLNPARQARTDFSLPLNHLIRR
jgi:hypothetical protein